MKDLRAFGALKAPQTRLTAECGVFILKVGNSRWYVLITPDKDENGNAVTHASVSSVNGWMRPSKAVMDAVIRTFFEGESGTIKITNGTVYKCVVHAVLHPQEANNGLE